MKTIIPCILLAASSAHAGMVITPTFTSNFNTNFGANAVAAQNAWKAAAKVFTDNFSDNITINITVDAVAGTSVFGQSSYGLIGTTYSNLLSKMTTDATTADDNTAVAVSGSAQGPAVSGATTWYASRAEAKALGLLASDGANDGTTTFGTGYSFDFTGSATGANYDFQGIAAHEISEVLGRGGLSGISSCCGSGGFSVIDLFSYSGAGVRSAGNNGGSFSIDNGSTLLKAFNNNAVGGLDTRDWQSGSQNPGATPDAFNQYSSNGVANTVTNVDLQLMDVIGYDRIVASSVPEPSTGVLLFAALAGGAFLRRRRAEA